MTCKRCKERVKGWKGDDPTCCFETGVFHSEGWNCATMNELRDLAETPEEEKRLKKVYFQWKGSVDLGLEVKNGYIN